MYLTYMEYLKFGFKGMEELEFEPLLKRAEPVLDNVTTHFYRFTDLETDVAFRKEQFKRAVAIQVEYFFETGFVTSEGMNSKPQSIRLGRTQIVNPSPFNPSGANEQKPLLSPDVRPTLSLTGLLSRGEIR